MIKFKIFTFLIIGFLICSLDGSNLFSSREKLSHKNAESILHKNSFSLRNNEEKKFTIPRYFYPYSTEGQKISVIFTGTDNPPDVYYSSSAELDATEDKKLTYEDSTKTYSFSTTVKGDYTIFYKEGDTPTTVGIIKVFTSDETLFTVKHPDCVNSNLMSSFIVEVTSSDQTVQAKFDNFDVYLDNGSEKINFEDQNGNHQYITKSVIQAGDYTLRIIEKQFENTYLFEKEVKIENEKVTQITLPKYILDGANSIRFISTCSFSIQSFYIQDKSKEFTCNDSSSFENSEYVI